MPLPASLAPDLFAAEGQTLPDLKFRRYDAQGARALRDTIDFVRSDAYADTIASGNPFYSTEAFMRRFDSHTTAPSFELVMAFVGDEPVGQIWGFADTNPTFGEHVPTFQLCEIMVRPAWTGRGIAHALHDELLKARAEVQAELYVRPDNTGARRVYLHWGWHKVGETRPNLPDAPLFDVLILPLAIAG
jgi:ribosomal protein S18 acetylase RimI-like enzyme